MSGEVDGPRPSTDGPGPPEKRSRRRRRRGSTVAVLAAYRKAAAALLGALSAWGLASYRDGYDQSEWWALVGVIGAFLGTLGVPNDSLNPED